MTAYVLTYWYDSYGHLRCTVVYEHERACEMETGDGLAEGGGDE
jgi:hypothetical protein